MRSLLLVIASIFATAGPLSAQEIYGIEPGMRFQDAEAKLKNQGRLATRDSSGGVYRSTFEIEQGLLTRDSAPAKWQVLQRPECPLSML